MPPTVKINVKFKTKMLNQAVELFDERYPSFDAFASPHVILAVARLDRNPFLFLCLRMAFKANGYKV